MAYNINVQSQPGQGAYGSAPGSISAPPSIWDQLSANLPGFGGLTSTGGGDILSQLKGILSPSTQNNIGNYASARGLQLGQPNGPISNEIGMGVTGRSTEDLQNQGLGNLESFLGTTGSEQQSPSLLSSIAETNSINNSAPNPAAAAQQMLALYNQYAKPGGGNSFSFNPGGGSNQGSIAASNGSNNYLSNLMGSIGLKNPFTTYSSGGGGQSNVAFA